MPKGLYTASTAVLLEPGTPWGAVEAVLDAFEPRGRLEPGPRPSRWAGGACAVLGMPGGAPGELLVDLVDAPWPDAMGNAKDEPDLFAAWVMGGFGPFVFPGCLDRAARHATRWPEALSVAEGHGAFARVRASQVLGAGQHAPILPEGYDAIAEMTAVTEVAAAILGLDGALAYFDPNGEVLLGAAHVQRSRDHNAEAGLPALDLWANVRMFSVDGGWAFMDTIGMEQVAVTDQEACFRPTDVDPNDVAPFLRELTLYLLERGAIIDDGHTVDGPGGAWRAAKHERSLAPAPRGTVRWTREGDDPPEVLRA